MIADWCWYHIIVKYFVQKFVNFPIDFYQATILIQTYYPWYLTWCYINVSLVWQVPDISLKCFALNELRFTSHSIWYCFEYPFSQNKSMIVYIYIYIYIWKLNQTVLELDFRAVKFLFFPRQDLNSYHWYTAAPFA